MARCLITKLEGVVNDASLLKLGELRFSVSRIGEPTADTQKMYIQFTTAQTLSIVGDGYFTDATLAENKGKTLNCPANTLVTFYLSNGDYEVSIPDKYSLWRLDFASVNNQPKKHFHMEALEKLKWCTSLQYLNLNYTDVWGTLEDLEFASKLTHVALSGTDITGDIEALLTKPNLENFYAASTPIGGNIAVFKNMPNMKNISFKDNKELTGDISAFTGLAGLLNINIADTGVTGSLKSLAGLTQLIGVNLSGSRITGNLNSLSTLSNLSNIYLNGSDVTGDVAVFAELPKMTYISLKATDKITGDLSLMPDNVYFVTTQNGTPSFTWEHERPVSARIMAMEDINLGEYLDAMLINQAKCVKYFGGENIWYKRVMANGTRTAASDAAVAKLKELGYTVRINGVNI